MGCGGSVMAADGSIAPGKGEVNIAVTEDIAALWYWGGEGKKVHVQKKTIPSDPKKLKDAKWETQTTGAPGILITRTPPGIAQQRYEVEMEAGGVHLNFPSAQPLDLCKKVHIAHAKDEKKYPDLMVKAASKKKEDHAYKTTPDKAKTDCDALANCVNPGQMHDDMLVLKDTLSALEEMLPGNNFIVAGSAKHAYGTWLESAEVAPKLSTRDQIEKVKDEQLQKPENLLKVLEPKEKVTNQAVGAIIMGLCKALAMEQKELVPDLDAMLARLNGKKPASDASFDKLAAYQKKMEGVTPPKPEEVEKIRQETVKQQLEEDQKVEAEKKEADKNKAALEVAATEKLNGMVEYAKQACSPAAEAALKKGTRVLARWKGYGYYEGVLTSDVKTGVISEKDGKKEEGEHCEVKFDDGESCRVPVAHISLEVKDPIKEEDCEQGAIVRANFFDSGYWHDGRVLAKNKDGTYVVNYDLAFTDKNVKLSNIRPCHDLDRICSTPLFTKQSFFNVVFTWIQAEHDLSVELRIWREFDDANVQQHKLHAFENKKITTDGSNGGKVHGGYKVEVPLWKGRTYCYNFKIGDKYYGGFGQELTSEKGFKRFVLEVGA
ncbi:hypothetical protein DIPPA_32975 [Diplonema papillatum]|nr:hypothetical protein DIPPA_32975 [Diplonema papillatum]